MEPDILRVAKTLPKGKFRNMSGTAEHIRLIGLFLWDGFFIPKNVQNRIYTNYLTRGIPNGKNRFESPAEGGRPAHTHHEGDSRPLPGGDGPLHRREP